MATPPDWINDAMDSPANAAFQRNAYNMYQQNPWGDASWGQHPSSSAMMPVFYNNGGGGYGGGYGGGGGVGSALNNMLLGGYLNYGNQLQGAQGMMALMNLANQNASISQRAIEAPIHEAQIQADAARDISSNRTSTLGPLLQALVGNIGQTAFGGNSGGFTAVGPDGKPFASATQGGSNAQPTNTQQYRAPQRRGFTQADPGVRRIGR